MKLKLTLSLIFALTINIAFAQLQYESKTFVGKDVSGLINGQASVATFNKPTGICVDKNGNFYVADIINHTIRKITPDGTVSTLAGSGSSGYKDGNGTDAKFSSPIDLCVDKDLNVYVCDRYNYRIRKITPNGTVSTLAGSGSASLVAGQGTNAAFSDPYGIACDAAGNVFVADNRAHKIAKITASGLVTIVYGTGNAQSVDGNGLSASFNQPTGLWFDASGNLFVAEYKSNKIRKITTNGNVTTIAGNGDNATKDATGLSSSFRGPIKITGDAAGNLFVTEYSGNVVRKISSGNQVTTIVGSGNSSNKEGIEKEAGFNVPFGVVTDAAGDIFVSDQNNNKIRKIKIAPPPAPPVPNYLDFPASVCMGSTLNYEPSVSGSQAGFRMFVDSVVISSPKAICKNDSNVFVVNANDSIYRLDFAGNVKQIYEPMYSGINAIAADNNNKMYVLANDFNNSSIKNIYKLRSDGFPDFAFGTGSTMSGALSAVSAIALGNDGKLYVADSLYGGTLLTVDTLTAEVTPLPQPGNLSYSLYKPQAIRFDKEGRLLVADAGNHRIAHYNPTDHNFYDTLEGIDSLGLAIQSFDVDNTGNYYVSANANPSSLSYVTAVNNPEGISYSFTNFADAGFNANNCVGILHTLSNKNIQYIWVADNSSNAIKLLSVGSFSITPSLPKGLDFDFTKGKIVGTPLESAPAQTYTVKTTNQLGTTTTQLNFAVEMPGGVNTASGNNSSKIVNQTDGMSVRFFEANNCAKMIDIEDKKGGTSPGNVQVTQTVYPTLASFSSGNFVGRKTDINAQNPNAPSRLKLYFTYSDIANFNSSNGTDTDLTNDTIAGTMQVGVLQLHTNDKGIKEQIKHNPVTATWVSKDKNWVVDFEVSKFSSFYMSESTAIDAFDCSSSSTEVKSINDKAYVWNGKYLSESGIYMDTIANANGCDSIMTLELTLLQTSLVNANTLTQDSRIYPNPTSDLLFVESKDIQSDLGDVTIVNLLGSVLYQQKQTTARTVINVSTLPKGSYFLKIQTDKKLTTHKFIVN